MLREKEAGKEKNVKKLFRLIPHIKGKNLELGRITEKDARALERNGFDLVVHAVPEDWGFETPVLVDKWIR